MSTRPVVRRTYGKAPPRTSSSSSLFDDPPTSPLPHFSSTFRSSSPPSSSRLETPPPSSPPTPAKRQRSSSRNSSPLFFSAEEEDEENADPSSSTGLASQEKVILDGGGKKRIIKKLPPKKAIQSSLKGFFLTQPQPKTPSQRKQPLKPSTILPSSTSTPSSKKQIPSSILGINSLKASSSKPKSKSLTQLHLTHLPLLHTCSECGMSFMRGGDDESIHIAHHTRVLRGIVWDNSAKGGPKSSDEKGWRVIKDDIMFGNGKEKVKGKGKIVVVDGSYGGNKLEEILSTVDTVLSSPPLPPAILERCKIFLFVTSSPPPVDTTKRRKLDNSISKKTVQRERVVGVVVAQGIKWAMRVLKDGEKLDPTTSSSSSNKEGKDEAKVEKKVVIESGGLGSVICDPTSLPTPLGIHRLYVSPSYRSNNISIELLNSTLSNTIYGCCFNQLKGEIAFSQPTQSGRAIMEKWGMGNIRVFVDDESQL